MLSQSRHLFAGIKYLMDSKFKKTENFAKSKVAPEGIHGKNFSDLFLGLALHNARNYHFHFHVISGPSNKSGTFNDDQEKKYFIAAAANYL